MFKTLTRRGVTLPRNFRCLTSTRTTTATVSIPPVDEFQVTNEVCFTYEKDSKERKDLESALKLLGEDANIEIPIVVGGEEIKSGKIKHQVSPFNHRHRIAKFYWATPEIIQRAIEQSQKARPTWEALTLNERIKIFLRTADLISTKYRMRLNAATMLGQAKTVVQAEIDAAAEMADFFRFNAYFAKEITKYQPLSDSQDAILNQLRHRGLEGFVAAISPFNFTAIGGNLASAPALMGNVVLWKPSDTAMLSNYLVFKVMEEAGFPPGVINFVPADGPVFGDVICRSPYLSGINFTGSVPTFRHLWRSVGENLAIYRNFPRLVGECGGKNFHLIHPSADVESATNCTILAAFEYSGQKCSACSRIYVAESVWPKFREALLERQRQIKVGSPLEFDSFTSAVIDEKAFDRIVSYIEHAKNSKNLTILAGGKYDKSKGYFIEPTIVQTKDPLDKIMKEEIFGPVTSIYVYADRDLHKVTDMIDSTTPFALTGAVFATDKEFLKDASRKLKMAAGNFYINDKCTGAVVGQQPFGGGRLSGTNDKAGGLHYLLKWSSTQAIKERFIPVHQWLYPSMKK